MNNKETSKALQEVFYQYTHLPIGGKEISCPYWMNKLKKGIYGPLGGKGLPEDIVKITIEEAEKEGLDLNKLSEQKINVFMTEKRIGIDCSGFVFAMLDALDKEKGGNGICDDIPHCQGKTICRANVRMLTDENIVIPIDSINDIQVGDMIRLAGGKHIAVIIGITREQEKVIEIEYAHSSGKTSLVKGVHSDRILIVNSDLTLGNQNWLEKTIKNENYGQKYLSEKDDGVKRLKIWA